MITSHAELAMTWGNMISRCYNPKDRKFRHYGGRGIKVVDRWHVFSNFIEDMSDRPTGHSLDRIDVNGPYSPDNCRWATDTEQGRNRRDNVYLTIDGRKACVSEWAEESQVAPSTIIHRVGLGWSHKDAVFGRAFAKRYPGVTYNSENHTIENWAARLGINVETLRRRMKTGMTFEEAIHKPVKTRPRNRMLTNADGNTKSLMEWASLLGVSPNTLRNRLQRKWPIERVLTGL